MYPGQWTMQCVCLCSVDPVGTPILHDQDHEATQGLKTYMNQYAAHVLMIAFVGLWEGVQCNVHDDFNQLGCES